MSAEDLENYETDAQMALTANTKTSCRSLATR